MCIPHDFSHPFHKAEEGKLSALTHVADLLDSQEQEEVIDRQPDKSDSVNNQEKKTRAPSSRAAAVKSKRAWLGTSAMDDDDAEESKSSSTTNFRGKAPIREACIL